MLVYMRLQKKYEFITFLEGEAMTVLKAEAVIITKPNKNTGLNGANFNMNGKILSQEAADKGYKGAGILSGEVVLCAADAPRESGAAEIAMNILSQHISKIKASGNSFSAAAESFFNHASREISKNKHEYQSFSATLLYNHADNVYIANIGDNAVYTFDGVYLNQLDFGAEEEEENSSSVVRCKQICNIKPNTRIIVLSKEVYEYTTDEQIQYILQDAISPKQACQRLLDQSIENGAEDYVTVLIENLTPMETAVAAYLEQTDEEGNPIPAEELVDESEEDLTKPSKAPLVVLILLLVIVALVAGLYFANQKYDFVSKLFGAKGTTTETQTETEAQANLVKITSDTSSAPSSSATESASRQDDDFERETEKKRPVSPAPIENEEPNEEPNEEQNEEPNEEPSDEPDEPTNEPTDAPTDAPTNAPTDAPSDTPSDTPSDAPSDTPSDTPSNESEPNNNNPNPEGEENNELENR